MRRTATYLILLLTLAQVARSHECEQNMLSLPNTFGYAKVQRGVLDLSGAFTIEFWMKTSSYPNGAGLIEQGRVGDSGTFSIRTSATNKIVASFGFTTGRETIESPMLTAPFDWNHVALVFDPGDSISFYLNGVLVSSEQTTATRLRSPALDSVYFGLSALTGLSYVGVIDECRIWFVPKTRQEIVAGMPNTFLGDEPGLAAYWRFDDDHLKRRFHDFTGNGRDGILVGSAELLASPSTSPITGPIHPGYMLDAIEEQIWMGTIFCGESRDTIIHIRNLGLETIEIDAIATELTLPVFNIPEPPQNLTLPPDPLRISTIKVVAVPVGSGVFWDTVIVTPKNPCGRQLRIAIGVNIVNTDIEFTTVKDTAAVDSVVVSHRPYLPCKLPYPTSVRLRNTGQRQVTIRSLRFTGQTGISLQGITLPFVLPVNAFKDITVRIDQGLDGFFTDSLIATAVECNRSDTLGIRFGRSRILYEVSPRSVDFGEHRLLPGSTVVLDTTIQIINTGTSEIFIPRFILADKGFKFKDIQNSENLYPGDTAILHVRFTSNECGRFIGNLIIDTARDACLLPDTIRLFATVKGPEFTPAAPLYKFPASCTVPQDTTIAIVNRSSSTVSIVAAQTLGDAFKFAQPPLPAPRVNPGDTFFARVRFSTLVPGKHRDTIRFFTDPCGYVDVAVEGYLGVGELQLSDSSIEFGTGCDIAAGSQKITVTNTTGKQLYITSKSFVGSSEITLLTDLPVTFKVGESKTFEFVLTPMQFGKFETTFSFTEGSCYAFDITARGVRGRAKVRWESDTLQMGEHCPHTLYSAPVKLFNDGFANRIIIAAQTQGTHFSVADLIGVNIAAGNWLEIPVVFGADSVGPFSGLLTLVLAPCGDTIRLPLEAFGGPVPKLTVSDTLIDFGSLRVGKSDTFCIDVRNASCIPIELDVDDLSLSFPSKGFSVTESTLQQLPKRISKDSLLQICFVFTPEVEGLIQSTLVISDSNNLIRVRLQGIGKAPLIIYTPPEGSIIEFGDVEVGDVAGKRIHIRNWGLDIAKIESVSITSSTAPYSTTSVIPSILLSNKEVNVDIVFKPTILGPARVVFEVVHELGRDTLVLLGRGVSPGLLFPASVVDFGNVRQWDDSTIDVTIKGSPNALFSLDITDILLQGPGAGLFDTTLLIGDLKLESPDDSLVYRIRYSPTTEGKLDTASFGIKQKTQTSWLPLRGRGVQAHMVIEADTVDFGSTTISTPVQRSFVIRNTGDYPLSIEGSTQLYPGIFTHMGVGVDFKKPIVKDTPLVVSFLFEPAKAVSYLDYLTIFADFPEKSGSVYLRGKGTYTAQGEPDILYRVDDAALRVGDIVDIPVYIGGADVAKVEADSLFLKIKYDPTVAYVFDTVITENTISAGMTSKLVHQYADSTIRITLSGLPRQLSEGILMKLRVEALLGPIDSTRFVVTDAMPLNTGTDILSSGLFYVTDCGDYRTNILLKGPYSISVPQPNPAQGIVRLRYELGLDGPVRITITDALGREVKQVVDRFERKGIHETKFTVDDLPSGSYIYTISSLEYRESGKLLIAE